MPTYTYKDDCLFCKISKKEIPSQIVHEDDLCVAFHDINAQAPVHILVIPRNHSANVAEVDDVTHMGELFKTAAKIAREKTGEKGFRLVVNTGDEGGQTVHHLHIHILGG